MGIFKALRAIFKDEKQHNVRSFVEILRTSDKEEALKVKAKLEKFKIPVYEIDHQKSNDSSSEKVILRIPEKYFNQAKEILRVNE